MNTNSSNVSAEAVGMAAEAADRLSRTVDEAKDVAAEGARRAQVELKKVGRELSKAASATETFAKENPWAAAGTALGVGILLGAVGYRLFAPRPTIGGLLGVAHLPGQARVQMNRQIKAIKKLF